jgi:hypothetical protein
MVNCLIASFHLASSVCVALLRRLLDGRLTLPLRVNILVTLSA